MSQCFTEQVKEELDRMLAKQPPVNEKNIKKYVGILVGDAYKKYCAINGTNAENKTIILEELRKYCTELLMEIYKPCDCKQKQSEETTNYDEQLQKIVDNNAIEYKYPKNTLSGQQRKDITMCAEKLGISAYTQFEDGVEYLIVRHRLNESQVISGKHIKLFSEYTSLHFDDTSPETFLDDVKTMHCEELFQWFLDDISRLGLSGFERLMHIFPDEVSESIKRTDKYLRLMAKKHSLDPQIEPAFTIHDRLFQPGNDGNKYISIDIKSAIFVAYHNNGVIEEKTWNDFLKKYTKSRFLLSSKKLRLKIFGKINQGEIHNIIITDQIIAIWNMIKDHVTNSLKEEMSLLAIEGDEMIFAIKQENNNLIQKLKETFTFPDYVNITSFQLKFIKDLNCYCKIYDYPCNKPFDLKCVNYLQYIKIYKHILQSLEETQ